MLSGLKFIPRDEVEKSQNEELEGSRKERKKSKSKKDKGRHKRRSSRYSSDDDLERIKSRKKKKWHASDDESFSSSGGGDSESDSEYDEKERSSSKRRKEKKRRKATSGDANLQDGGGDSQFQNLNDNLRKQMGLDFMLRPKDTVQKTQTTLKDNPQEVPVEAEEIKKVNPKELNPYLKDNGSGDPEDSDGKARRNQLFSSSLVGDGGASWRLKALKRAQEQAAREGRDFEEVVKDRWGSVGQLAVSVAAHKVSSTHAHLHAIKNRRRGLTEEEQADTKRRNEMFKVKDGLSRKAEMRMPNVEDSLSWKKRKVPAANSSLSAAISTINKFSNDGSFMHEFMNKKNDHSGDPLDSSNTRTEGEIESNSVKRSSDEGVSVRPTLTANQLAAKALQLRMKGKHEEAEKLLKEAEDIKAKLDADGESHKPRIDGSTSRYIMHDFSARQKMKEEDADAHLAQKIMRNQQYKVSGQADDEYDYDVGTRRKSRKKGRDNDHKSSEMNQVTRIANRMLTQKERCQFCFENPTRPKHLVVAIANFTYLALPHWQPVVPGHCCILTLQHESSTRTVDDNVWDEIRNFKKCLIMMCAKQDKDFVFLETVMGLAQQRRHCLVECIPLPKEIAKQGSLYFKKAIDEAEEEWSQHNAKKLIDTSQKGLRASIPKNFPYFHVEFGLNKGFVHVIDDETQFKSNFGLNVIRGMLRMPAEDMHSRRKHESLEMQKQSVASFVRDWEPFDWTKQLD